MSLIPQLPLEKLPHTGEEIRCLPSIEIFDEKGYVGTFIIPSMEGGATIFDEIKTNAEYLGVRSNIVVNPSVIENVGKEELVQVNPLSCLQCGFFAKSEFGLAVHRRRHVAKVRI